MQIIPVVQGDFRRLFDRFCSTPLPFYFILWFCAALFWLIHAEHVSRIFENETFFSHMSTIEREMIFRSEMGMYFSFYKRLINSHSYATGLLDLLNDTKTEYPSAINSLQRFNLYPEVIIAGLYRAVIPIAEYFNIKSINCWRVARNDDDYDVVSCTGFGESTYFYLSIVWQFAGFTMSLLFLYGYEISGSIIGGVFTVLCYLYNHTEATRIQWTPPLRESFGYPCGLLQMFIITKFLKFSMSHRAALKNMKRITAWIPYVICITMSTAAFLIMWQLSQFVVLTQLIAVLVLYTLGPIDQRACFIVTLSTALAIILASIALFFNDFLVLSTLTCLVLSMLITLSVDIPCLSPFSVVSITVIMKGYFRHQGADDDAHIINFLLSKFTSFKDFHTMLYTCSNEFDFLPFSYVKQITSTLLLPTVLFGVASILFYWFRMISRSRPLYRVSAGIYVDAGMAYNFLQATAFAIMATLVMRLKLFLTPHLCLLASCVFHKQFHPRATKLEFAACFALLLSSMTYQGYTNITNERSIMGEFNNAPLEELLNWVLQTTSRDDVFAGPMPLMANIMLSTGRRVVNHPHYEHSEARQRTLKVYSIFSRKNSLEVFNTLLEMGVNYIIIDGYMCFSKLRKGCNMIDLWDIHDPVYSDGEPLCPQILQKGLNPFIAVFVNEAYVVFKVDPHWRY